MADSITIQNNNIMPLVDDLPPMESKLSRRWRDNCKWSLVIKDLRKAPSQE